MNDQLKTLLDALPCFPHYRYDWDGLMKTPLGSWLEEMAEVGQNPIWHQEGDVLAHTRLVTESLCGMEAFRRLPRSQMQALALAALLHDVGKVKTTRLEDGQLTSPGHAGLGVRIAREILWKDFLMGGSGELMELRETACLLIRQHMTPIHLLDKEDPEKLLIRIASEGQLARPFSLKLLYLLSLADILGRKARDVEERCQAAELFRQSAEDLGCFTGPLSFQDDYTQRAFFKGRKVWHGQSLYNDTWGEVTLLCALPGSGKDHWAIHSGGGLPTVSLDDLRREMGVSPLDEQGAVVQAAQNRARAYLRARQPFIWNATNLTQMTRGRIVELCEGYQASVRILYLEAPWQENLKRNADRQRAVPQDVIERMLGRLCPPQRWEAQRVEWICQ